MVAKLLSGCFLCYLQILSISLLSDAILNSPCTEVCGVIDMRPPENSLALSRSPDLIHWMKSRCSVVHISLLFPTSLKKNATEGGNRCCLRFTGCPKQKGGVRLFQVTHKILFSTVDVFLMLQPVIPRALAWHPFCVTGFAIGLSSVWERMHGLVEQRRSTTHTPYLGQHICMLFKAGQPLDLSFWSFLTFLYRKSREASSMKIS